MSRIWTSQPQFASQIDWSNPITRGLFVAIEDSYCITSQGLSLPKTGSNIPPHKVTPKGIGRNTAGGTYDIRTIVDGPLPSTASWSIAVDLIPTANAALSHLFGFGVVYNSIKLSSNSSYYGKYRSLLNYNNNYYFWGNNADWDTGIAFNTDGSKHNAVVTSDGTTLRFYLDGVFRASSAKPALTDSSAGSYAVLGNQHDSAAVSPSATLLSGRAWNRALSASEIKSLSDNPWQVFQPLPSRIFVGPAAAVTNPSGDLAATEGSTDTSAFTGIVLVQGTAAATDSGSDTFAATGGAATSTGTLAATETGDDTATSTGTVLVKGTLAATDSGSDSATSSGTVLVQGTAAATETGDDTATSTGTVLVQGAAAATDSGTDTFAATGGSIATATGTLDATEVGDDSATSSGTILVQGLLAALEAGGDTVYIDGQIYIVGACAATETGSDTFAAGSAAVVIPGALVGGLRDSKTQTSLRAGRIQTGTRNAKIQLGRR